jgi:hypothetical protein
MAKETAVHFFLQRHGYHQGDLTELGKRQVQRAAIKHLKGKLFDKVFSSEMPRAVQTAEQALLALGHTPVVVQTDLCFGYSFAEDARWPHAHLLKQIDQARKMGVSITVDYVLNSMRDPPCLRAAGGLLYTMHQWAQRVVENKPAGTLGVNILVGSHGTNVLASTTPQQTPWANFADIMRYDFGVDCNGNSRLIASEYLAAPIEV